MPGQRQQLLARTVDGGRIVKRVRGGGSGGMRGMGSKRKLLAQWSPHSAGSMHMGSALEAISSSNPATTPTTPLDENSGMGIHSLESSPVTHGHTSNVIPSSPSTADLDMGLVPYVSGSAEKIMQPPEEPPYFPEKWSGKLCALCCLGERSQLGQGEMLRIEIAEEENSFNTTNSSTEDRSSFSPTDEKSPRSGSFVGPQLSNRRQKGHNKCK